MPPSPPDSVHEAPPPRPSLTSTALDRSWRRSSQVALRRRVRARPAAAERAGRRCSSSKLRRAAAAPSSWPAALLQAGSRRSCAPSAARARPRQFTQLLPSCQACRGQSWRCVGQACDLADERLCATERPGGGGADAGPASALCLARRRSKGHPARPYRSCPRPTISSLPHTLSHPSPTLQAQVFQHGLLVRLLCPPSSVPLDFG